MPSFSSLIVLLSAVATTFASHQLRNHNEIAKRVEGHLSKRFYSPRVTWYPTDTGPDACTGRNHGDYDAIIALNVVDWNNNANCGRRIKVTARGKTAYGVIQDRCASCYNSGEIDMTKGLFLKFASLDEGVFTATWQYADGDDGDDEPAPPPPPKKTTKKPTPKPTPTPAKFVAPKTTKSKSASKSKSSSASKSKSSSKASSSAKPSSSAPVVVVVPTSTLDTTPTEAVGNVGGDNTDDDQTPGIAGGIASDGFNGAASITFNKFVAGAAALLLAAQAL